MLLVDDQSDTERLVRRAQQVPIFKERKRNIFIHDENIANQVPHARIKKRKLSIFSNLNHAMTADDLDPILELYASGKTAAADAESDDLLMVIVPGPPPDAPFQRIWS